MGQTSFEANRIWTVYRISSIFFLHLFSSYTLIMFYFLYMTACFSAVALVSSRPRNLAAVAIREVKREADTKDNSVRLMDKEVGSQESREAIDREYGCYRETACWRECRQESNCDAENLKCFVWLPVCANKDECSQVLSLPCSAPMFETPN